MPIMGYGQSISLSLIHILLVYFIVQFSEIIKSFIGGYLVHKGVWANNVVEGRA